LHLRLHAGNIGRIDHDQGPAGRYRIVLLEAPRQPAVFKAGVLRAVVGESPAENAGIESLRLGEISGRKLDVVYPAFVRFSVHASSMMQAS
jgi:hypothetical protein